VEQLRRYWIVIARKRNIGVEIVGIEDSERFGMNIVVSPSVIESTYDEGLQLPGRYEQCRRVKRPCSKGGTVLRWWIRVIE
jgi:hypothetical protein